MILVQSTKVNGRHSHAYLKNVLERMPVQQASMINERCWKINEKCTDGGKLPFAG
jgi:hypothetical protein